MTTYTSLKTGLGGAIGCDFDMGENRLYFVEYSGKLSRVDLVSRRFTRVSSGTATVRGTWSFDFDGGAESTARTPDADVWWRQRTSVRRELVPLHGAALVALGKAAFDDLDGPALQALPYAEEAICGDDNAKNQLVTGNVFAVRTSRGNLAKVKVVRYDYNLRLKWVTYRPSSRYGVLGSGYTNPEDVVLSQDGETAYITERGGNLLRVRLDDAQRSRATVVASGMTAPHQMWLDEDRSHAYVVEFARPGRLLRVDLRTGAKSPIVADLNGAIGLVITRDLEFAYVSEQDPDGDGRIRRIEMRTGRREVVADGLTEPFFLSWADPEESALLVPERDPSNRVLRIDLTTDAAAVTAVAEGVPARPSSVAAVSPSQLVICSDNQVAVAELAGGALHAGAPFLMGIGHVPVDRIVDGYADTTVDPGYFFQVKDAPFGGTLALMFNHTRAYAMGARYYQVLIEQGRSGTSVGSSFNDYRWNNSTRRFELQTTEPVTAAHLYPVRSPDEVWYNHWLGMRLNTRNMADGLWTIRVRLFRTTRIGSEVASRAAGRSVNVRIDNSKPTALIDAIIHDGSEVGVCGIVNRGSHEFTFRITAHDHEGHLKSWRLVALWGQNKSAVVATGRYQRRGRSRLWYGVANQEVPRGGWNCVVPGDPTSYRCAHTFYLWVWDRVIDGYVHLHRSGYHRSITIMLPQPR